jgi:hypothetical protein
VSISEFEASVTNAVGPVVAYVIMLPIPMYSEKRRGSYCAGV